MTIDRVWKLGYYEAWKLWFILEEIRMRDLQNQYLIMDSVQANEAYRAQIGEWLKKKQPRQNPQAAIPDEVLKAFEQKWATNG